MDQLRNIMKVLWQQRFWVLSCVGIIVAAICWKMASAKLDAEFVLNRGQIDGKFGEMDKIIKTEYHGNPDVNEKDRREAMIIRDKVVTLWQSLYDRQRASVLKWPAELGPEFIEYVKNMRFRDPINSVNFQQVYREFAVEAFPALVEIVKAKKVPVGAGGAFGGDGGGFPAMGRDSGDGGAAAVLLDANGMPLIPEDYLVEWHDQEALRLQLDFKNRPRSTQIWVTQEDLWVYETMLHCIANTNKAHDATRPDNAAIRWIMNLEVGQKAAFASRVRGQLLLPPGAGVAADAAGADGGVPGGDGGRGGGDGGAPAGADSDAALLAYRYIGADGAPIPDATTDSGGEIRRLPVRMVLYMQQRAIPTVLIECANAALPIEVKRIRINAEKSGAGFDADFGPVASAGGPVGGDSGGGGRDGGPRGGGYSSPRGGDGGGSAVAPPGGAANGLVTVEIQGVVYIYNPPDAATMSVPGGDEVVASAETVNAAL